MTTEDQAAALVNRFSVCKYWGSLDGTARMELVKAMRHCSVDFDHGTRVVDAWLFDSRELPTPVDLRTLATATRPEEAPRVANLACQLCGGSGWTHSERWMGDDLYTFAHPCRCRPRVKP
jgi:hypothetical protein